MSLNKKPSLFLSTRLINKQEPHMEFIKIRFANDFDGVGSKFEKTIAEMFQTMNPMFSFAKNSWKPQLDIYEMSEEILITAEIPGVDKEHLELEINSRAIRIAGIREAAPVTENGRYRLAEIQYGSFERILRLNVPIDTENVTASYKKGMLHIHLKKLSSLETTYRVRITDE